MTQPTTFAIVEMNSQTNILANLQSIEFGIQTASERGATLVVLPENAFCFGQQKYASQYFEALKDWSAQAARHYGIYLLAGTLPCPYRPDGRIVADGKLRQSSLLFDPAGACVARYDKMHLFKATVNDSTGSYDEGKTFEAGNQLVVANTDFGKVGMMVCFDIRFPTLAIKLRELGAEVLTAPSAFTYQTGKAHWHALLTARALDSQCLMIGAGQTGEHLVNPTAPSQVRRTWGHSEFINSNGERVTTDSINYSTPTANLDPLMLDLPLSAKAKSWLEKDEGQAFANSTLKPTHTAQSSTLIFAEFDRHTQQQTRQNIALLDCQKLSIIATTS